MNRRGFLRAFLAGTVGLVAGAELDLDKLLWVPGAKTIFLPDVKVLPARTFVVVGNNETKAILRELENNLRFASRVNRDYDRQFANEAAKVGETVNVRLPGRWAYQEMLKVGDVITFESVNVVNPRGRRV